MSRKNRKQNIVVILGPTASGKSALAVWLAKKFNGEIISADSRQIYRGLALTSGAITRKEMHGVPHYLLGVVSLRKRFTAEAYRRQGLAALRKITAKHKVPIICGGAGFYIDALLYESSLPHVKPNNALRKKLEKKNIDELFGMLKKKDPRRAESIDPKNKVRLIRALEIIAYTRRAVPSLVARQSKFNILFIGLSEAKEVLQRKIRARIVARLARGMVHEVQSLHNKERISWRRLEELGLDARYVSLFLQKKISRKELIDRLTLETWRYAKRQMTWFKKNGAIRWVRTSKEAEMLVRNFLHDSH